MDRIVILTGAGISAESGLATFRDADGIWSRHRIEDVATPEAYARDPEGVLAFYNARRETAAGARPNAAHVALARLSAARSEDTLLVTQNIDDLHERAGATGCLHMHGELSAALCAACGQRWRWTGPMILSDRCPACDAAGRVRPDVVWFGEIPYHMDRILTALGACDLFVAIGTSGSVYPAAGFVAEAAAAGAATLEINVAASEVSPLFARRLSGSASEVVPRWVGEVLGWSDGN